MAISGITSVRASADPMPTSTGGDRPSAPASAQVPVQPSAQVPAPADGSSTERAHARRETPAAADASADPAATFATGQYLQQLLAAQVLGAAPTHLARPSRITPERLSALVDYLEGQVGRGASDPARGVLDTSG